MKLTAKLTLALLLGVLILIVAAETLSLRHENEQMNREMRADAAQLAETISRIVEPIRNVPRGIRTREGGAAGSTITYP